VKWRRLNRKRSNRRKDRRKKSKKRLHSALLSQGYKAKVQLKSIGKEKKLHLLLGMRIQ